MEKSFNAQLHEHCENIRQTGIALRHLADAFAMTGNHHMADQLSAFSETIRTNSRGVLDTWSRHLSKGLNDDQRAVGENLRAMLKTCG